MTIFSFINDILYKKSGTLIKKKSDEQEIQPYMISRWISMYSNDMVKLLAGTINKVYGGISDKEQWYKLYLSIIPKVRYKKSNYIKKINSEENKTAVEDAIEFIAKSKKISKREVRQYVQEYGLDLTELNEKIK